MRTTFYLNRAEKIIFKIKEKEELELLVRFSDSLSKKTRNIVLECFLRRALSQGWMNLAREIAGLMGRDLDSMLF